jgi:septum formation protein
MDEPMQSSMARSPDRQWTIVLASASPRRRALLIAAGFACDVDPVDVDEGRRDGEPPGAYVERVARAKAGAGAARHAGRVVLAADTAVVVGNEVLGKPRDDRDAERMLRLLSGRSHEVLTAVAVVFAGRTLAVVEPTTVWVEPLTAADIAWYVATGEPLDKAGAYAIQGLFSRFVPRLEGSYTNVVGLPVATVARLLRSIGPGLEG